MLPRSVVGLFCDDIREEKSGQHSLIGIYSDNINMPSLPSAFPKLAIYIRITLDVTDPVKEIALSIVAPGAEEKILATLEENFIRSAQAESANKSMPTTTLISQIVTSPYVVRDPGMIVLKVLIEGVEYLSALMNVHHKPRDAGSYL
ncbi:MAG: hypothetical protein H6842_08670 [Rhodospirillaceae bacterium]|jgi:hypothetical protein|nr:hypothetical protein [Rhodospirillaceae bacterium]